MSNHSIKTRRIPIGQLNNFLTSLDCELFPRDRYYAEEEILKVPMRRQVDMLYAYFRYAKLKRDDCWIHPGSTLEEIQTYGAYQKLTRLFAQWLEATIFACQFRDSFCTVLGGDLAGMLVHAHSYLVPLTGDEVTNEAAAQALYDRLKVPDGVTSDHFTRLPALIREHMKKELESVKQKNEIHRADREESMRQAVIAMDARKRQRQGI